MELTFLGCGDAFGSGGRFNTCFHLAAPDTCFLIDCGASSLIAMKRFGVDRNSIDTIFVTHFHADHFGGIPFFILDAQLLAGRETPLTIVGPEGLERWYERVLETAFPGSAAARRKFEVTLVEITPDRRVTINGVDVLAARVRHGPVEGPFLAYRFSVGGKSIAYTGDTEWVDSLVGLCKGADLLISEAYFHEKKVPLHLDLKTLEEKLPRLAPGRLILTHMNEDMLNRIDQLDYECAEDGMVVEI
ncbi:MAG: MBL fold metallo-hydrolase [Paracoccaceae bacterium]